MLDQAIVRIGMLVEQLSDHQNEAGCTKAALERARFNEGFLLGAELAVGVKALDRLDVGTVDELRKIKAARHRPAVHDYRAAATQALTAAFASTVEAEVGLQQLDQIMVRLNVGSDRRAVEVEADGAGGAHYSSSSGLPLFARNARSTVSGLSGRSTRRTSTASSMALAMAGDTQKVATSPTPLAPNGPFDWKVSTVRFSIAPGTSWKPGIL